MTEQRKLIDFEKARKSVMEILAGKVTTPIAVKVAIAMQEQSVDAVEVVQCEDCKFCRTFFPEKQIGKEARQVWYCDLYRCNRKTNEYCSDGEKREETMDVREKLWRIVKEAIHSWESDVNMSDHITDNLIAHGVTVQDNTEITDELLKQLRNAPLTVLHEEPTIEVVQEWISVKDRLPDREGWYITQTNATGRSNGTLPQEFEIRNGVGRWRYRDKISPWNITHWQPMPQPPKGE